MTTQQTTWTRCSDRMPPDDEYIIMNDIDGCLLIKALNPILPKNTMDRMQWIPCDEATWMELTEWRVFNEQGENV